MADKKPIRTVFNDSGVATGLAEFQTGDTVGLAHGGIGAALSIGSAGQVLKVNTGGTALEFGAVEAIVNIDGATDLTGATLVATDKLLLSDGGSEGRVNLSQIDTLFKDTTQTLTNKTISGSSNTLSNIGNSSLSNSAVTVGTTSISLGGSATTIAGVSDLTAGSINIAGNVIKSNDSTIVEIGGGDGLSVAGNMTVTGNLTVSGSTTTVSSTNTTLADQFIELGTGRTGSASGDSGLVIERGSDANAFIGFDEDADEFSVGTGTFTGSSSGNLSITKGTFSSAGNRIYNGANYVAIVSPSLGGSNVTLTLPSNDGDSDQVLKTDGSGNLSFSSVSALSGSGIQNTVEDTTPQLGGDLDVVTHSIVSTANRNIAIVPNGSGKVLLDGDDSSGGVSVSDGLVEVKTGTGSVAKVKFYCESGNAHAQTLQAAPHSAASSAVLVLPTASGNLIGTGDTSTVTNAMIANSSITIQDDSSTQDAVNLGETLIFEGGSGITTTVTDNKVSFATDGSIVTETSTDTLTNKTLTSPKINENVALTATATELNLLDGVSGLVQADLTKLAAVDATATELNHTDGVTSNIQTQLDAKAAKSFAIAQAVALG